MFGNFKKIGLKSFSFFSLCVSSAKSQVPSYILDQIPNSKTLLVDEYQLDFTESYKQNPRNCISHIMSNSADLYNAHNLILIAEGIIVFVIMWDIHKSVKLLKNIEMCDEIIDSKTLQDLNLIFDKIKACKKLVFDSTHCDQNEDLYSIKNEVIKHRLNITAILRNLDHHHFRPLQLKLSNLQGQTQQRMEFTQFITKLGFGAAILSIFTFPGFDAFSFGRKLTSIGLTSTLAVGIGMEFGQSKILNSALSQINSNLELLSNLQNLSMVTEDDKTNWISEVNKLLFKIQESVKIEDLDLKLFEEFVTLQTQ